MLASAIEVGEPIACAIHAIRQMLSSESSNAGTPVRRCAACGQVSATVSAAKTISTPTASTMGRFTRRPPRPATAGIGDPFGYNQQHRRAATQVQRLAKGARGWVLDSCHQSAEGRRTRRAGQKASIAAIWPGHASHRPNRPFVVDRDVAGHDRERRGEGERRHFSAPERAHDCRKWTRYRRWPAGSCRRLKARGRHRLDRHDTRGRAPAHVAPCGDCGEQTSHAAGHEDDIGPRTSRQRRGDFVQQPRVTKHDQAWDPLVARPGSVRDHHPAMCLRVGRGPSHGIVVRPGDADDLRALTRESPRHVRRRRTSTDTPGPDIPPCGRCARRRARDCPRWRTRAFVQVPACHQPGAARWQIAPRAP